MVAPALWGLSLFGENLDEDQEDTYQVLFKIKIFLHMDNPVLPACAPCPSTDDPSLSLALESSHNQLSEAAVQINFSLLCASSHTQSFFLF